MPLPDSIENLALQAGVSTVDHFEDLNRAVEDLDRHVTLLSRAHGAALTGVLVELVDDVRHAFHGAQRTTATSRGGLIRRAEGAEARLDEYVEDERRTMETLEALVVELERRNRRSHAKTSRELAKARELVDEYRLEQS